MIAVVLLTWQANGYLPWREKPSAPGGTMFRRTRL